LQVVSNDALLTGYRQALGRGDSLSAYSTASHAVDLCEKREDWRLAGFWRRQLSLTLHYQGKDDEASAEAERSLELQTEPFERTMSLAFLSTLLTFQGRRDDGHYQLGRADEAARQFPRDTLLDGLLRDCKGAAALFVGDFDQSVLHYEAGSRLMLQNADPRRASGMLQNMGFALALLHRFGQAERQLLHALELGEKDRDLFPQGVTCDSLGHLYLMMGRNRRADLFLTRAVKIFKAFSNRKRLIDSLIQLSEARERVGLTESARRQATRALELARLINSESLSARAQERLLTIRSLSSGSNESGPFVLHGLFCASSGMKSVAARLRRIAPVDATVLLSGETGTGKELAARAIHHESKRRNGPFIAFNCSALSRDLAESRLFGHRKGAFTSANQDQTGVIRTAQGGTLFLDEIGDLPVEAQGALLRFFQSGEIQPVGASNPQKVDVRVIAATNRDLWQEAEAGRFRKDLYYRLNVVTLRLPPLRCRADDIAALARHFAKEFSKQYGLPEPVLSQAELARLCEYEWPGNVRELENFSKRRVLFGEERLPILESGGVAGSKVWRKLTELEKSSRLIEALELNGGNITATARYLGISRRAVQLMRARNHKA
jgi:DNA-binding NtrC family response regulator